MVVIVQDVSPYEMSDSWAILRRGLPQTQPELIFFFFLCMGISLICMSDKHVNQSYSWTKHFKLLKGLTFAGGKSRFAKSNI